MESIPNLLNGAIPGGSDYVSFLDGMRSPYDTSLIGPAAEIVTGLGAFKILNEIGAATRFVNVPQELGSTVSRATLSSGARLREKYGHLSAQERRALIEIKGEAAAGKALVDLEVSIPNAHFRISHGEQTGLYIQYDRAMNGINPNFHGAPGNQFGTRFLSNREQLAVMERSMKIRENVLGDLSIVNGDVSFLKQIVFDHRNKLIGDGFAKNTGNFSFTNRSVINLRNNGLPYTAHPIHPDHFLYSSPKAIKY